MASKFPWQGTTCRKVGDLLIALHVRDRRGVLTSNGKDHGPIAEGLGHEVRLFVRPTLAK